MQTGRYRNVPVVDVASHLVGVVRQSDIIRYLAESFPEELLNLPPRTQGMKGSRKGVTVSWTPSRTSAEARAGHPSGFPR